MPYLQAEGGRIYFVEQRPVRTSIPPPVIFIHGAGASHQVWIEQVRTLGRERRSIAVDLPGHGRSEGSGAHRIETYRDIVVQFMAGLGLDRTVLVGHSMGGAIAQSVALAHTEKIAALVLVGTGARLRVQPQILAGLESDPRRTIELIAAWGRAPGAPAEFLRQDADALLRTPVSVIEGDLRACDAFDIMQQVNAITLPTLVICGAEDLMTPPKYADYLHRQIADSQLALIPAAGHMVMLEKPEEVGERIKAFIANRTGRGRCPVMT
ncbi:MAG: alpha/beta hydrolase [Candidatus Methylomirabilota bacterium]|nr:MAG: alpha/beta hydrolase [candidate division NC10 bacterium]